MLTKDRTETVFGWRGLLRWSAAVQMAMAVVFAVLLGDIEAAGIAMALAVGMWLLRRPTIGIVLLGLLSANVAFWMVSGTVSNIMHSEGIFEIALPALMAVAALTGTVAAVGAFIGRRAGSVGTGPARATAVGAVALLVVTVVVGAVAGGEAAVARSGDVRIVARDTAWDPEDLEAPAGTVTVHMANEDLFWHTFTVPDLDVNLNVPVKGERRITFEAPPGTYEFVCAIPGHTQAGMTGTLIVR